MRLTAVITLLIAMGTAGCNDAPSEQTDRTDQDDTPKKLSPEDIAAQAKRILAAKAPKEESVPVRSPGFFNGNSTQGRRQPTQPTVTTPSPTPDEPVKRPTPNLVKPNAQAERQFRLAKLYTANAASAPSTVRRKFLHDKAATILKEIISKYPQAPIATQAKKLLTEIETTP
jgi:hypothetical protein